MRWAVIDTSVYIDHWERRLYTAALNDARREFVVRHSSVVLSELRRGARSAEARGFVDGLSRLARIQWVPTSADWWEAGRLIRTIGDQHDWDVQKRRAFQNDALIALTARRHGATVITADRRDFEPLGDVLYVPMRFVTQAS